jgi:hypothetical protein
MVFVTDDVVATQNAVTTKGSLDMVNVSHAVLLVWEKTA